METKERTPEEIAKIVTNVEAYVVAEGKLFDAMANDDKLVTAENLVHYMPQLEALGAAADEMWELTTQQERDERDRFLKVVQESEQNKNLTPEQWIQGIRNQLVEMFFIPDQHERMAKESMWYGLMRDKMREYISGLQG